MPEWASTIRSSGVIPAQRRRVGDSRSRQAPAGRWTRCAADERPDLDLGHSTCERTIIATRTPSGATRSAVTRSPPCSPTSTAIGGLPPGGRSHTPFVVATQRSPLCPSSARCSCPRAATTRASPPCSGAEPGRPCGPAKCPRRTAQPWVTWRSRSSAPGRCRPVRAPGSGLAAALDGGSTWTAPPQPTKYSPPRRPTAPGTTGGRRRAARRRQRSASGAAGR